MSKERRLIQIYPWTMPSTDSWSLETGLLDLRDAPLDELVEILWENGSHVQNTGILELMNHGNPRRAAEVARTLVERHPECNDSIRKGFGPIAPMLLEIPLQNLASKPEEFPPHIEIIIIQ